MTAKIALPNQALSKSAYRKLVSDISNIFERARGEAKSSISRIALKARWEIGRRIVEDEQKHNLRAEYGAGLLTSLSRDLTRKYGNGFSETNLKYMRQFYVDYPKWPIRHARDELGWSHYRELVKIDEKAQRDFFEKQIIDHSLSYRDLVNAIRKHRQGLEEDSQKDITIPFEVLSFTRGRLNTYKIIAPEYIHRIPGKVVIDCGFQIKIGVPLRGVKKPAIGDIVEAVKTSKGYKFKRSNAEEGELYTFKALVEEVIDADTIWANINCGFDVWITQKLRFRGINAPEVSTKRGLRAKRFVEGVLSKVPFVIIKTHKSDKYDRYLVDLFYLKGGKNAEKVLRHGTFLNQELIDKGLAVMIG